MNVTITALPEVLALTPARFTDARGFFSESWNHARMADAGLTFDFVQDNHSFSQKAGTLRGLHFQSPPHAQDKLVRCGRGAIFDVAVDIRRGSPTFGHWVGETLSFENGKQLLIPAGFLHGFLTLTDDCEVIYKCTDHYAPDCDGSVAWDDPDIGIQWPCRTPPILSAKDAAAPRLTDLSTPFIHGMPQ